MPSHHENILFVAGNPARAYHATRRATAPPQCLGEHLYDAAIHFCREALDAFDADDFSRAAHRLTRAQEIVHQLQVRLHGESPIGPAGRLVDLCGQVQGRLVEADFYRSRQAIEQTLDLLLRQRNLWKQNLAGATALSSTPTQPTSWIG